MINFIELEKSIDIALSKETPESLTAWLLDQRKQSSDTFLGAGFIEHLSCNSEKSLILAESQTQETEYLCNNVQSTYSNLSFAA